ncbi:MAG: RluA family pseudouridine synthase [Nitrospinae bacterium]|nr:RluA family pseudouridine synthase [Nitrospinota bacterium]MZH06033.1 RluA family pseudouridine synthase [Nitrospinota bacterium]
MQRYQFEVDEASSKKRLDIFLSENLPEISRSRLKKLIDEKRVTVNEKSRTAGYKVRAKETIEFQIPPLEPLNTEPESLPLDIIFEDEHMLVVNKPAGMVVHPAPGHARGTLVNALLHYCKDLSGIGGVERPGIVHRLDKETSGLVLVAKTEAAHKALAAQFKKREIKKEYCALVKGNVKKEKGTIDSPVGRHQTQRKKMDTGHGRPACTHFEVLQRGKNWTCLKLQPETGRTHQIRVHLASIHHPVIGDKLYGGKNPNPVHLKMERQALHARQLELNHPVSGKSFSFSAKLPLDMENFLQSQK